MGYEEMYELALARMREAMAGQEEAFRAAMDKTAVAAPKIDWPPLSAEVLQQARQNAIRGYEDRERMKEAAKEDGSTGGFLLFMPEVQVKPEDYKLAKAATWLTNKIPDKALSKIPLIGNSLVERKKYPQDEQFDFWATDIYHGFEDNVRDHYKDHPDYEKLLENAKKLDRQKSFMGFPASFIESKLLDKGLIK